MRASLANAYEVPADAPDFACPHGRPWGYGGSEPVPARGPGTELKKLLAKIGIKDIEGCACKAHAEEMDAKGPDWCAANLETIVGWLREESERRKLPFSATAAGWLVRLAIRRARKAAR